MRVGSRTQCGKQEAEAIDTNLRLFAYGTTSPKLIMPKVAIGSRWSQSVCSAVRPHLRCGLNSGGGS